MKIVQNIYKKKCIGVLLILVAVLGIISIVFLLGNKDYTKEPVTPDSSNSADIHTGALPGLSSDQNKSEHPDLSSFTTQMNKKGTIQAGSKQLNLPIANPGINGLNCFVSIKIDGEYLYTSAEMKPNTYLDKINLYKPISKGTYLATVYYFSLYKERPTSCESFEIPIVCK